MERYLPDKECVVMSREEVRAVDSWAINEIGVPGVVLMENAGRSCAELIREKLAGVANPKVCIFCGTGNNGGDGYVIGRHLLNSGLEVVVVICGERGRIKGDAKMNLEILEKLGQVIEHLDVSGGDMEGRVKGFADGADMIVDGLFGTGLSGQLRGEHIELIEAMNGLERPIVAVDIPSGLDCDSGEPLGAAVRARWTVTFVAVKKGIAAGGAREYTGEVFVSSIGVAPAAGAIRH
jgi:hydroxyethylthiazole kinase-like uncharacterized protein yjeF